MKNIIIQIIIVFFIGLILCHIYNKIFNKTLEGMGTWSPYNTDGSNPDAIGQTAYDEAIKGGKSTDEAEKQRMDAINTAQTQGMETSFSSDQRSAVTQAKIAGELQSVKNQQTELAHKIGAGGEKLNKRVANIEMVVGVIFTQIDSLKDALNDLANTVCDNDS